jgi:hypothetical protein
MYFAKNYLVNQLRFVLLFPNFQRSFGLILTPVFLTECKGKYLIFITQIFLYFFSLFFLQSLSKKIKKTKKNRVSIFKNYRFFYLRTAKIKGSSLLPNFFERNVYLFSLKKNQRSLK